MYIRNILNIFHKHKNIFIIFSFILLSIISSILLIHSNFVNSGSDIYFHWQRYIELKSSFSNHYFFPKVALNTFDSGGSSVMTFYPYFNLLPMLLLSYIIKSNLYLIYFSFILYTFSTLMISYYSSLNVNHRIDTSYLFSIMYGLSSFIVFYGFKLFDIGILSTVIFFPLFVFGFINFIKNNKWLELSLGLTLISLTHVLNTLFTLCLLIIWLIINLRKINSNSSKNALFKCLSLTFITNAIFYIPLLKLMLMNNVNKPFAFKLKGIPFSQLFSNTFIINTFNNNNNYSIGVFALLGIFIPLLYYKKFNYIIKQMYWLSIGIIIIVSTIFPWGLFQNSFMQIIQFTWRIYFIPQLLLTYIFALGVTKYCNNKTYKKYTFIGLIIVTVLLQLGAQNSIVDKYKNGPNLTSKVHDNFSLFDIGYYKMNSNQINNLSYGFSSSDYYPEQSSVWLNQLKNSDGIYNINHYIHVNHTGNGNFEFYNNENMNEFNMPFVGYNGLNYKAYLDNHEVPFTLNQTNLFTLFNVNKGTHHVKIKTVTTPSDIVIRILFIIGIIIYIYLSFPIMRKKLKSIKKY